MSCFDEKIYIQGNQYDGLALGYQSQLEKNGYLNNYLKKPLKKHIVLSFSLIKTVFLSCILNLKKAKKFKKM